MGFVHEDDEIIEVGEVVKVAFADVFGQTFDAWAFAASDFGVDFGDVEDVDFAVVESFESGGGFFVVVASDDFGGVDGEFGDAFEDVFWGVGGEVGDEFVVDR